MSVKYSWNRQNGAAMPSVRFMSIEPAEDYYKGMPLKLKEKGIVEPTDGDPEYICMAQYDPDAEIQPLEIPVQEVFPDVVYDRMNEDGSIEEVRFGSKGGDCGDLLETVEAEVPLVITWDGNAEGKETIGISDNTIYCVKISDAVLTKNELLGSEIIITKKDGTTENVVVTENIIQDMTAVGAPILAVIREDESYPLVQSILSDFSLDGVNQTAGIWLLYKTGDYVSSLTCPNATTTTTKQQLKPSLLPPHKHKWDDMTDKPFGMFETTLYEVENALFSYMEGDGHSYAIMGDIGLVGNETYTVNWDGTPYKCNSQSMEGVVFFGNGSLMGMGGNNEPFLFVCYPGQGTMVLDIESMQNGITTDVQHSFSISGNGVQTLEQKYIPGQCQSDWLNEERGTVGYIANKPFGLNEAYTSQHFEWDGDLTGKETITLSNGNTLCKVSEGWTYSPSIYDGFEFIIRDINDTYPTTTGLAKTVSVKASIGYGIGDGYGNINVGYILCNEDTQDPFLSELGLTSLNKGLYLAYSADSNGNVTHYVESLSLWALRELAGAYLPNVVRPKTLQLQSSSGYIFTISVDDSGNLVTKKDNFLKA